MKRNSKKISAIVIVLCGLGIVNISNANDLKDATQIENSLLESGQFIHIPGPNPVLQPGTQESWDSIDVETADAFKDFGTYYLYYHGTGKLRESGKVGYRLGVATASHPLGPFKKYADNPIVEVGTKGSWDDYHTACAMILKEGLDKYYMWYSGYGLGDEHRVWSIGLATASHPLGPWKKHEANPILKDFGYVGGVVKVEGKYYMYCEHPIGSTGDDYAPLSIAVAERPQGPWKPWKGNPAMKQGEWGEWDDGGISEAEVVYHSGVFHMFYGGAKLYSPRRRTRESIGYAYSLDGYNFVKYGLNPVVNRQSNPNVASFSEVHAIFEAPFIYLYHTTRYKPPFDLSTSYRTFGNEEIGVQVLATQETFTLDMPVLNLDTLAPKATTYLIDCPAISLSTIRRVALTAECVFDKKARKGLRIYTRSSYDGLSYDTTDLYTFDLDCKAGQTVRETFELDTKVRFIKLLITNRDSSKSVSNVKVTATLGG